MIEEIVKIIREYIPGEEKEMNSESKLIEDLGMNSYEFMSLIGRLEEEYDIEVDEREVTNIKTIGDIEEYVKQLQFQ